MTSLDELAGLEGEDLLHRVRRSPDLVEGRLDSPLLGRAVDEARQLLGLAPTSGIRTHDFDLDQGAALTRSFLPRSGGVAEFSLDVPADAELDVVLRHGRRVERHRLSGHSAISFPVDTELARAGEAVQLTVRSTSGTVVTGQITSEFPLSKTIAGVIAHVRSTRDDIESVLQALSTANPGLSATVPDWVLYPENARTWLDLARTYLATAGVCSISDLGKLRLNPAPVLRTGLYVAPLAPPPSPAVVTAVDNWAFSGILGGTVLYYVPNDTLHDMAFVLAGEWDIRGQTIVIGREIRELVVIVKSIRHDAGSRITWEQPPRPGPGATGRTRPSPARMAVPRDRTVSGALMGTASPIRPATAALTPRRRLPSSRSTCWTRRTTCRRSISPGRMAGRVEGARTVAEEATGPRVTTPTPASSTAAAKWATAATADGAGTPVEGDRGAMAVTAGGSRC